MVTVASFLKNLKWTISREGELTTEQESTLSLAFCNMRSRRALQEEGDTKEGGYRFPFG
jgi:hypothetical protein